MAEVEQWRKIMKRKLIVTAIALFPTLAMAGPQEEGQAFFDKFVADFSSGNAEVISRNFASEAIFWGTNSRDLITGSDAIKQYFVEAFKRLAGAKATPVGKPSTVSVAENVLAVSGIWRNERMVEGKTVATEARNSVTLVRRDGRWLIISFSNSPRPQSK